MNRVLIVVTSSAEKSRIYDGAVEWSDGWRFDAAKEVAVRDRNFDKVNYLARLTDLDADCAQDRIIWIRGKDEFSQAEVGHLKQLIRELCSKCAVYFAYHDDRVFGRLLDKELVGLLTRCKLYGLPKGSQFARILQGPAGQSHLNNMAPFDELFGAFFLIPSDILGFLKHKLVGILSPIDIDLQGLLESNFDPAYWEQVVADYRGGSGNQKIELLRRIIYDGDAGLKRLVEQEQDRQSAERRRQLTNLWNELRALIPNGSSDPKLATEFPDSARLYGAALKIVDGLRWADLRQVRENVEGGNLFRRWMDKIDHTMDELRSLMMSDVEAN